MKNRKAIIDDGMCPELVRGAEFDGIFQIPKIKAPSYFFIPKQLTPYSYINQDHNQKENAVCFYENDYKFADLLINPDKALQSLTSFGAFITLDCSLYRNAPLTVQIANIYKSRSVGCYAQNKGFYVIPQVRWGTEETFTTKVLPEKVAFLGIPKRSIVAISPYGCFKSREDKLIFEAGLAAMLEELDPKHVLVYGPMPDKIFRKYDRYSCFHHYDDWLTLKRGGKTNG